MLNNLARLHAQCFPHRPWSAEEFHDLKKSGCEIIASDNGFIVWRKTLDEAELITIGVAPDARGTGIAAAMMGIMENELRKDGVKKIFLEVAQTNTPARALYDKCGYVAVGTRPKYYDGIDGIVMEKNI